MCFQIDSLSVYNQHSKAIIKERQLCNATIVIVHQPCIQQTGITIAPYIYDCMMDLGPAVRWHVRWNERIPYRSTLAALPHMVINTRQL